MFSYFVQYLTFTRSNDPLVSVSQLSIGLTLLSIEKGMLNEIDYDNLINDFASQKEK